FYYVWLRRALSAVFPTLFATVLSPKALELIASPYRHEGSKEVAQSFFEEGLEKAFKNLHSVHISDVPLTLYYAFKQSEESEEDGSQNGLSTVSTGWETMLSGLIRAGFSLHGTWPFRTESVVGLKPVVNALASSIVLVCRRRPADAPLATRKQFITALRQE